MSVKHKLVFIIERLLLVILVFIILAILLVPITLHFTEVSKERILISYFYKSRNRAVITQEATVQK